MNPDVALKAWGLMLTFLPWVVGVFLLLILLIAGYLGTISKSLKNIATSLKELENKEKPSAPKQ